MPDLDDADAEIGQVRAGHLAGVGAPILGAQILREVGVARMQLMGRPRRMPSMTGYGLEITGYIAKD